MTFKIGSVDVITSDKNLNFITAVDSASVSTITDTLTKINSATLLHTLSNPNNYSTATSDFFGTMIAADGDYVAISATGEDDASGSGVGIVYVYSIRTGTLLYTLNNPNATGTAASDGFGKSLAAHNGILLASADGEDVGGSGSGSVYVFDFATGTLIRTIANPNAYGTVVGDSFGNISDISGSGVGIHGNYIIIGAGYEDDISAAPSGKAYIFNASTGALLFTLNNPSTGSDEFGGSVAIYGNYAIVGAINEDVTSSNSGSAYIYNVTTGTLLHTLNNPTAAFNDEFGTSVDIYGNYAIVGVPDDDQGASTAGQAHVYNVTTGTLLYTLNNPSPLSSDEFGRDVKIKGSYAFVGRPNVSPGTATAPGSSVYIYDLSTGNLVGTIDNPNAYGALAGDKFGYSIDISNGYLIAGAPYEDQNGATNSGKAYIYSIGKSSDFISVQNALAWVD
jgi:hypothetical protein